jgi:hypothetical protein
MHKTCNNRLVMPREEVYKGWQAKLEQTMSHFKIVLSAVAALLLAEFIGPWSMFRGMSTEKATGLAAVAGGFVESLFSPLFWVIAIVSFFLFFYASRLGSKVLRIFLFWTPILLLSTFGMLIAAFFVYVLVFLHFPRK